MHLYREVAPHLLLAAHVACFWTSRMTPGAAPLRHRVLPDNCIDILWQDRAPLGFVAGMMSRAHHVQAAQPVTTVAVRFLPGAARASFRPAAARTARPAPAPGRPVAACRRRRPGRCAMGA